MGFILVFVFVFILMKIENFAGGDVARLTSGYGPGL